MRTTPNLPESESPALRWDWLNRLASHLSAAYAGEDDGGDEGTGEDADPAVDDDETAFGGDDEDLDAEPSDEDEGGEEEAEEAEEEDDDSSLFDEEEDPEEESEGEEEEGSEDEDEEILDEEAQAEHDERVESLNELWDGRLERAAEAGEGQSVRPNVKLGEVKLRKEGLAKFKEILAKEGEDAEVQAEAIFEVAMDAAIQTLTAYDSQHVQKHLGGMSEKQMQSELDARWEEFTGTPAGKIAAADEKLRGKMQEVWNAKVKKAGGSKELAMRISMKDYFRLAGGRVTKKALAALRAQGDAPAPKGKKKSAASKAKKRKAADLAASRSPRARRTAGLGQQRKAKTEEEESADYILASEQPFFSVN